MGRREPPPKQERNASSPLISYRPIAVVNRLPLEFGERGRRSFLAGRARGLDSRSARCPCRRPSRTCGASGARSVAGPLTPKISLLQVRHEMLDAGYWYDVVVNSARTHDDPRRRLRGTPARRRPGSNDVRGAAGPRRPVSFHRLRRSHEPPFAHDARDGSRGRCGWPEQGPGPGDEVRPCREGGGVRRERHPDLARRGPGLGEVGLDRTLRHQPDGPADGDGRRAARAAALPGR